MTGNTTSRSKEWGSSVTTGLIVLYSHFVTSSNPHVDRCSSPFPGTPLVSPKVPLHDISPFRSSFVERDSRQDHYQICCNRADYDDHWDSEDPEWVRLACYRRCTANPRSRDLEYQGFDSVRFSVVRGGIPRSIWNSPAIRTQRFVVCGFSVCGLAVYEKYYPDVRRRCISDLRA